MKAENVIGQASLVEKEERKYPGIRFATPFAGMFARVAKEWIELRRWAKSNRLDEKGPYFLRYYHCDMNDIMDVEIGLISNTIPAEDAKIKPGILPKGTYASLIYRGNGLRGNQALMKWAKENGIRFDPAKPGENESYRCRYEAYLTDYRIESRKLLWDIELSIKVMEG